MRTSWPSADEIASLSADGDRAIVADTAVALSLVRKAKSEAKVSMKADVASAVVRGPAESLDRISAVAGDLKATGSIAEMTFEPGGDTVTVDVTLA